MAYIVDHTYTFNSAVSSITGVLPDHNSGDMLLFHAGKDTTTGGAFATPSGYTLIQESSFSGTRQAVWYKIAGASETAPSTSTTDPDEYFAHMIAVRDIAASSYIDASQIDTGAAASLSSTALTTTSNDCLILYLYAGDNNQNPIWAPGPMAIRAASEQVESGIAWYFQKTAGTCPTVTIEKAPSDDGHFITVAIKSSATPVRPPVGDTTSPAFDVVTYTAGDTTGTYGGGSVDPSTDITTVDGLTFTYDGFSSAISRLPFYFYSGLMTQYTPSGLGIAGGIWSCTSIDLSGSRVCANISTQSGQYFTRLQSFKDKCIYFGLRSGTGYRIWHVSAFNTAPAPNNQHIVVVDVDDTTFRVQDTGTFNSAAVDGIFFATAATSGEQRTELTGVYKLNTPTLILGSSTLPAKIETVRELTYGAGAITCQNQGNQSSKGWLAFQDIQIGNGSDPVYFSDSGGVLEFPKKRTESERKVSYNVDDDVLTVTLYGVSGDTISWTDWTTTSETTYNFTIHASSTSAATWDFSGHVIVNANVTWRDIHSTAASNITFRDCPSFTGNSADFSGGCTFDNTQITLNGATQAALQALLDDYANCSLLNGATAIRIEYTGTGNITLSFDNMSFSGNTVDIHYNSTNSSSLTATMDNGSDATTSAISGSATGVTISSPTADLTLTSSESGTLLQIFTTGTQTVLDSTTGTSLVYTHSSETVDVVAQKAGFLPQRQTGIALSGDVDITFNLVSDPVYDASHGLTYTTDASWSRASNQLTVPTFGPSVRAVHSLMIDSFISEASLRNTAYNIQMNGPNAMFLINDAEGASDASIENMTAGGVRYVTTAGATAAEWVGIESIGTATGFTGEYQQQDGSGTTDARATGSFDEIIKTYGDATHGNFDYRSHLVLKYQPNGYREVRVDVLDTYGISSLEPAHYIVAMEPQAIAAATGDPAISITVTDHGASPVTWNSKDFSITITDSAGGNSAEDILRELNYNLSLDATYNGKDPFNWPEMVVEEGSNYATARGITEGGTGAALKGVRVVQNDGTTPHAGFARFQADDGTYFTPATVAQVSAPNVTAGRIQIYNSTAAALSAWQATTAYAEGDRVLATTGKGTSLGDGVFFVCTTAGTSGGTEPTWDEAADGNTTADGTVTWTVRPVEFANTTTTSGYSSSWTDGEHFTAGDTIRMRWVDEDDDEISATGVATAEGTTTFLNSPVTDEVYTSYGITGSGVTEYSADYPNVQVDVTDPDNVFYLDRFYAWWKYNLTLEDGIRNFFGGVTATNTSNITINNSVIDIYFDNTKATSARQGDTIVIQRADGAYPQVTTTSGGGGLGFYYSGIGYSTSSGSGLDTTERNKLLGLRDYDPETDTIEGSLTYQEAQRVMLAESAGKVAVSGTTVTFRDQADTKDRITATVDDNGQRTSVTIDGS